MASLSRLGALLLPTIACTLASAMPQSAPLPPFADVSKEYERVVSTPEGNSLFGLYVNRKDEQMLAEFPRGWERMRFLIAATPAGGVIFSGLQGPEKYVFWRQYGNRLALVQPQLDVRSTGEQTSDRKSTRLNSSHIPLSRMPSSA